MRFRVQSGAVSLVDLCCEECCEAFDGALEREECCDSARWPLGWWATVGAYLWPGGQRLEERIKEDRACPRANSRSVKTPLHGAYAMLYTLVLSVLMHDILSNPLLATFMF